MSDLRKEAKIVDSKPVTGLPVVRGHAVSVLDAEDSVIGLACECGFSTYGAQGQMVAHLYTEESRMLL